MQRNCPGCGSKDVRCSRANGVMCSILRQMNLTPYRCRSCRKRFFSAASATDIKRTRHRLRRFGFAPLAAKSHAAGS